MGEPHVYLFLSASRVLIIWTMLRRLSRIHMLCSVDETKQLCHHVNQTHEDAAGL